MQKTSTDTDISIQLESKQKREFAELLLKCNSISDPAKRNIVVGDLETDFAITITQTRTDTIVDIRAIIEICIRHNCFDNLIEAMEPFDGDASPLKNVKNYINRMRKAAQIKDTNIRKKEQYDALEKILSTITDKQLDKIDLATLHASSVPCDIADKWNYTFVGSQREKLMEIIEKLKGAVPLQGELYANQKFICGLALQLSEKKRADLDNWVNSTIEPWGTEKQKINEFREQIKQERQQRKAPKGAPTLAQLPHLLISLEVPKDITREQVQLDKRDAIKFCVTAWLFYGKDNMKCIHVPEVGEFYTSATVVSLLKKLRKEVEQSSELDDVQKLHVVIDFFLRHEFFVLPVEQWGINETSQTSIGKYHPVVLRSFERLSERYSARWKMKWEQVHNPPSGMLKKHIHWICDRDELGNNTLEDDLLPDHITCLGLTLVPLPVDDTCHDADLFYSMLNIMSNTGTPVALWLRELPPPEDHEKLKELLHDLLSKRYVSQLPHVLRKGKLEGLQKEKQDWQRRLLNHLVLLWEDPDVIPSDECLVVPGVRKT